MNWLPGSEIYIFGYSRGAYIARILANLICSKGLIAYWNVKKVDATKRNSPKTPKESENPTKRGRSKGTPPWLQHLQALYDLNKQKITIKCLGLWDMVKSVLKMMRKTIYFQKSLMFGPRKMRLDRTMHMTRMLNYTRQVVQIESYESTGLNRKTAKSHMKVNAYLNQKSKLQPLPASPILHISSRIFGYFISQPYPNVAQPVSHVIRQRTINMSGVVESLRPSSEAYTYFWGLRTAP
jgi:uncharacterized protein (DUF2235 family)